MIYARYDYHPDQTDSHNPMETWWEDHWKVRSDRRLQDDLTQEPAWGVIKDTLDGRTGRLLEAGCGIPQWVNFLNARGFWTVGVDYTHLCLQVGKIYSPELRLVRGDLRTLPFPDRSFDFVVSLGAVEHDVMGPKRAIKELARVLASSGRLLCSVPCLNIQRRMLLPWSIVRDWLKRRRLLRYIFGKTLPFEFYEYIYSPRTYIRLLEACGLEVLDLHTYAVEKELPLPAGMDRLFRRIFKYWDGHMILAVCRRRRPDAGGSVDTPTPNKTQRMEPATKEDPSHHSEQR